MHIFLRGTFNLTIEVESIDSTEAVKAKIQDKTGY